jgi:hypothetical protein
MKKRLAAGALAGAMVLGLAGPAAAAPPERVPRQPDLTFQACGTTLTLTDLSNSKIHFNDESIKLTGPSAVQITTADGRSAFVRVNGSLRITFLSEDPVAGTVTQGVQGRGLNLFFSVTPGEQAIAEALGFPVLALTKGPISAISTMDVATGEIVATEVSRRPPHVEDVCTLLR